MTQAHKGVDSLEGGVDPQDWVTIWQSEWAAIAVDREVQEGLVALTGAWNTALAPRADGPPGFTRPDAAAGAASAGDASGAGQPEPPVA
jgi:hypothetical protein